MRRIIFTFGLVVGLLFAGRANATLIDRGGGLIYDTALNITWLQNANQWGVTGTWDQAKSWADGLTYGGFDDWRLPYISVAAGAGPFTGSPVNCSTATEVQCRANEYGGTCFITIWVARFSIT